MALLFVLQLGSILLPVINESCTTSSPGLPPTSAHFDADRSAALFSSFSSSSSSRSAESEAPSRPILFFS